jgi:5'(3')-deoxyribonucleotidase
MTFSKLLQKYHLKATQIKKKTKQKQKKEKEILKDCRFFTREEVT